MCLSSANIYIIYNINIFRRIHFCEVIFNLNLGETNKSLMELTNYVFYTNFSLIIENKAETKITDLTKQKNLKSTGLKEFPIVSVWSNYCNRIWFLICRNRTQDQTHSIFIKIGLHL